MGLEAGLSSWWKVDVEEKGPPQGERGVCPHHHPGCLEEQGEWGEADGCSS